MKKMVASSVIAELYLVIDLSEGSKATNYPVAYLDAVPEGGWTDGIHRTLGFRVMVQLASP